jgi:DNA polymerase V
VIFSSNYPLYGGTFQRVMTTLREFGPNVEVYSIDEVFMDLHGMQVDWQGYGHKIRNTFWRNICMPVGKGIAPVSWSRLLTAWPRLW